MISHLRALAPLAPPCFETRGSWLAYLEGAVVDQRLDHGPGPLVFKPGEPVRFNRDFSYCADCRAIHAHQMWLAGRCDRGYLLRVIPQEQSERLERAA